MSVKPILEKLALLADAAKYDASCASSGTVKRNSTMTICHRDAEGPARLYRIIGRAARDRWLLARKLAA